MIGRIEFTIKGLIGVVALPVVSVFYWIWENFTSIVFPKFLNFEENLDYLNANLINTIIVITGANTGIGKATATRLASSGATVILACRDEKRGKEAANEINLKMKLTSSEAQPYASKGKAKFMRLDLSDLHSITEFASNLKVEYGRLDILINNAGLNTDAMLSNGLQQLFQVNYLGHYLLFRAVEDLLHKPSNAHCPSSTSTHKAARVINLSSVMHHSGQPNFKISSLRKYQFWMKYTFHSYYDDSKLYMHFLTMQINSRNRTSISSQAQSNGSTASALSSNSASLSSSGKFPKPSVSSREIIAVSVNPGAVSSDIWRHVPFLWLFNKLTSLVFLNTQQGAMTSILAATIPDQVLIDYMNNPQHKSSTLNPTGNFIRYQDVPYFVPYYMVWQSLIFETLGYPSRVPQFSGVSLPSASHSRSALMKDLYNHGLDAELEVYFSNPADLADQLWDYSAQLSLRILIQSGMKPNELVFLSGKSD